MTKNPSDYCRACKIALAKEKYNEIPVCKKCKAKLSGGTKKKRKPIAKKGKSEYQKALDKCKTAFQRLRRAESANEHGMCECVNGHYKHWKKCDGGHYMSATYLNTCFVKMNVNPQSKLSNKYMGDGRIEKEYREWLVKKYGEKKVVELERLAHVPRKYSIAELDHMAEIFRKEANKVIKEKGI